MLNHKLRALCAANGISFVDFYDAYATNAGELEASLSDGGLHIDPKQTKPIVQLTAACLGIPLTHRPLDRDLFLIPVGNYVRRRRQLIDLWFKSKISWFKRYI